MASGTRNNTLCWDCAKANCGCSWSREFKPVDGWNAIPTKLHSIGDSYEVIECPLFEDDSNQTGSYLLDLTTDAVYYSYREFARDLQQSLLPDKKLHTIESTIARVHKLNGESFEVYGRSIKAVNFTREQGMRNGGRKIYCCANKKMYPSIKAACDDVGLTLLSGRSAASTVSKKAKEIADKGKKTFKSYGIMWKLV